MVVDTHLTVVSNLNISWLLFFSSFILIFTSIKQLQVNKKIKLY